MAVVNKILIVGGGVAGLSAAIALQKIGMNCDVVEIGEEPVGASMSLSGRATDALVELGVYDECYESGAPFRPEMSSPVMHDSAGKPMGAAPPRPEKPNAKVPIGVFRPTFARILEKHAISLGANLMKGMTVDSIGNSASGANVILSDGSEARYDLVVGADGINSRVRKLIFTDAPEPQYAGQMSIRWMIPGPRIEGEAWYVAEKGRLGFFHMPKQELVYVPLVVNMEDRRLSQQDAYEIVDELLSTYSAPAVVNLRSHLKPDSTLICRPFKYIFVPSPWYRDRVLLIGDAAHATTAHMGMGAGMALEDSVVLAQSIASSKSIEEALSYFMERRLKRVKTVVETSVALSKLEQINAPREENSKLMGAAYALISHPY